MTVSTKGSLRRLPRVVIGIEKPLILKLAKVWIDPTLKKDFAQHPVQVTFLEEIREQLRVFQKYAESVGQPDIAQVYGKDLEIIEIILRERKEEAFSNVIQDDRVHNLFSIILICFQNRRHARIARSSNSSHSTRKKSKQ